VQIVFLATFGVILTGYFLGCLLESPDCNLGAAFSAVQSRLKSNLLEFS
jgi:hypothetical protein